MTHKKKLTIFMFFLIMGLYLGITNNYHFLYIEQLQLFLFSSEYLLDKFLEPGGFSAIAGEFLIQFFSIPFIGAFIIAALLTLALVEIRRLNQKYSGGFFFLDLLPILSLLLIQYNFNYKLQGTVAFLLGLFALNICIRIKSTRNRLIAAAISTPLLFWLGGAISFLFSICLFLRESLLNPKIGLRFLLIVLEALLIGLGSVHLTLITEYRFAFLPDAYFHQKLFAPFAIYFAWISLPISILGDYFCSKKENNKHPKFVFSLQVILFLPIVYFSISKYDDRKSYTMKHLDYLTRTHNWDEIIHLSNGSIRNKLHLNYLNMALMEKQELGDKLFNFDQHGPQSLLVPWNKTFNVSTLLSDIYFTLGEIALSQEMAFEANLSVMGNGNPRNLQRLIQTNLITKNYKIAEKYISILEKTFAYRRWAQQHRQYIYNDELIEKDPVLGKKRKALPLKNTLIANSPLEKRLLTQAEQYPCNPVPIQFTGSLFLLKKDLKSFKDLVEKYYGTPMLPSLPKNFQEAVLVLDRNYTKNIQRYNINKDLVSRFEKIQQIIKQNDSQLPQRIKESFGDSYWAYILLNN